MNLKTTIKVKSRIVALLLVFVMLLSLMPINLITVFATHSNEFTFKILDKVLNPIAGAKIIINQTDEYLTDSDGIVLVDNLAELNDIPFLISKVGYQDVSGSIVSDSGNQMTVTLLELDVVTVSGCIKNLSGDLLQGVDVQISGYNSYSAQTDSQGRFSIENVFVNNTYSIGANLNGYKKVKEVLNIDNDDIDLDISLEEKQTLEINFEYSDLEVKYGERIENLASNAHGVADNYESLDTSIAMVDNNGRITPIGIGITTIKAVKNETDDYKKSETTYQLTVTKGEQADLLWSTTVPDAISWDSGFSNIVTGGTGNGKITYISSNNNIATVDELGNVTMYRPGNVKITAKKDGGILYKDKEVSYELNITKAEQQPLNFDIKYPSDIIYGDNSFINRATGGSVDSAIKYSIDGDAATIDNSGKITTIKSGNVTVTAKLLGNYLYEEVSSEYTLFIKKADQSKSFTFSRSGNQTITYGDKFNNLASGGENSPITYMSSDESIATVDNNGDVVTYKSGEVIITAINPSDDRYNEKSISYNLTVNKAEQDIVFENEVTEIPIKTYGESYSNKASAKTTIQYISSDESIATVNNNGTLKFNKSGTVVITAYAIETGQYNAATKSYTITIKKAPQNITYEKGIYNETAGTFVVETTFNYNNNEFTNTASSIQQGNNVPVTYSIASGHELVENFNEETGSFTIIGAGKVVISSAIDSNEQYKTASSSYTLIINKAKQSIAFENNQYNFVSGHNFDLGDMPRATENCTLFGTGEITYQYYDDINGIVKSFNNGDIILNYKKGSVRVIATKAADNNYESATAEYIINVIPWVPETDCYSVIGDRSTVNNDWFNSYVSLQSNDGYLLSLNNTLDDSMWRESLDNVLNVDGINSVSFYVKNSNGDISDLITENIYIDTVVPEVNISTVAPSIKQRLLSIITFGIFGGDSVEYTIESNDATSGVYKVEYFTDKSSTIKKSFEELNNVTEWQEYDNSILVEKDSKFIVYAKVTDNAGNIVYTSTDGIIFDATKPVITISPSDTANEKSNDYFIGDVHFNVNVSDSQPSSSISKIDYRIFVNGEELEGDQYSLYNYNEENLIYNWSTSDLIVPAVGLIDTDNVRLTVIAEDLSGNISEQSYDFNVISEPAIVSVTTIDEGFYKDAQQSVITISGRSGSFKSENIKIHLSATDAYNNEISDTYTIGTWVKSGDNHTATITFNKNANYRDFYVEYRDSGECGISSYSSKMSFTIDSQAPTGNLIIDNSNWAELLETVSFGLLFENSMVTITANAQDDICTETPKIEYYKSDDVTPKTFEYLDNCNEWKEFNPININEDDIFTIYLKITDAAGNYNYISSKGYILDTTEGSIEIIPETANENGYYNKDVNVTINVEDNAAYSGIKTVVYWVITDGIETQRETIFSFENTNPTYAELVNTFSDVITIDAETNNSDNVVLKVKVVDNAGNEKTESINVKIDVTKPTIRLYFDSNNANVVKDRGYFRTSRKAYVEITERTSSFNELNATSSISINAVNYLGEEIELNVVDMISNWVTERGTIPDEDKHTAEISFSNEGNYEWELSYTDNAGNENTQIDFGNSITPFTFTIDKTIPTATISVNDSTWDKLLDFITFGIYSKNVINISATANDDISPISLEYCKLNDTKIKTSSELDKIQEWKTYNNFSINCEEVFIVYIKATDAAGNYRYISSNGAILDTSSSQITLIPEHTDITHNNIGVYNHDVEVEISINEKQYSGIKTVEYWVITDGIETQRETIFSFENTNPTFGNLVNVFSDVITVDAEINNSCDVNVYVGTMDNAGNYNEQSIKIDIDNISPSINIDYDNNNCKKIKDDRGYFASARTAIITVEERDGHFNLDDIIRNIQILAKDVNSKEITTIDYDEMISTHDNDLKHIYISYSQDANYDFSICYQDIAGNNANIVTDRSITPYRFTIDTKKPTATITVGESGKWARTWEKIVEKLTFGLWSKDSVTVDCTVNDNISPIESISYYKTSDTALKNKTELEGLSDDMWIDFAPFDIGCNDRFVIYLRAVDYAGNTEYISTNGIILDNIKPVVEEVKPEITITPEQPVNGLYNNDVNVSVKVVDKSPNTDNVYSGLREVKYEVYNMGNKTQEGILYNFDLTDPTQQDLCQVYEQKNVIVVNKDLNNSNDVIIKVFAVDNAGNDNVASVNVKIDISAPIVKVDYNNNDGDIKFADTKTDAYFRSNRTATITISERNFDPTKVLINITNPDGDVPQISGWSIVDGTGNGDDTLHVATVDYVHDGDYTFDIKCCDMAENNGIVNYNNSVAPNKFTIDKTNPIVNISYDNNNSRNGNYYNASRTATIIIREHNFETSRVNVKLTAIDNGTNVDLPYISGWTSSGDVHTAQLSYISDALYTFDFEYKDKAGNSISDIAQESFYIDKTNPTLSISNIVDHSANNSSDNIGFTITTVDTNLDTFNPVLTATVKNGNSFESKQIDLGTYSDIPNGKVYTVNNISLDGIYRITCVATDKAGNKYSNVTLYNNDGSTYLQNSSSDDTLLTFSVNRNGSTFEIDKNTTNLINKYYVQKVKNNVVLIETNTDDLVSYEITLNNKKLKENKDYKVALSNGNSDWSKYTYTINKSLFENEGEYTIVVSSVDKATNNSFSDVKDASVKFVVDRSAPVVAVTGIGNNSRYKTNQQSVTLIPADDGGSLKSLIVALVDNDGNIIKELVHLEELELQKELEGNNGKINFDIDEGLYQNVKVICTDYSVDDSDNTNIYEAVFNNISVSSNSFMIFWANKSLRYVSIIGIVAVICGIITYIIVKKRKQKPNNK